MTQGQVDGLIKQKLSVEYTIRKTKMDVHLKKLENDSIYIFRQAYRSIKNISMLWSLGKDSNVMVWLAFKAFFGKKYLFLLCTSIPRRNLKKCINLEINTKRNGN